MIEPYNMSCFAKFENDFQNLSLVMWPAFNQWRSRISCKHHNTKFEDCCNVAWHLVLCWQTTEWLSRSCLWRKTMRQQWRTRCSLTSSSSSGYLLLPTNRWGTGPACPRGWFYSGTAPCPSSSKDMLYAGWKSRFTPNMFIKLYGLFVI